MTPAVAVISSWSFKHLLPITRAALSRTLRTDEGVEVVESVDGDMRLLRMRRSRFNDVAPHAIDHASNLKLLSRLGTKYILATAVVGSLRSDLVPGAFVLLDDFIDFRRSGPRSVLSERAGTFTDFTHPYSPVLRDVLLATGIAEDIPLIGRGCYVCVDGPRYETPAEVTMFRQLGGDVVGMTNVPEAVFARELGLEYAAIGLVSNFAAGVSSGAVSLEGIVAEAARRTNEMQRLVSTAILLLCRALNSTRGSASDPTARVG